MKVEVIKDIGNREYMVELYHGDGIAYGHFTHIGEAKDKFIYSAGTTPKLSDDVTKIIREEIRRFEVLGHTEYKKFIAR